MDKHEIVARLRRDLQAAVLERQLAAADPGSAAARVALRRFQAVRMARTHADLLAVAETSAAAQFFLDDLYGAHDFTQRDADIERIIPMMERMLPVSALRTIAEAIELDALSEALDREMAVLLGEVLTKTAMRRRTGKLPLVVTASGKSRISIRSVHPCAIWCGCR